MSYVVFSIPNLNKPTSTAYTWKQQMHNLLFNLLVMNGGSYMFRHYTAILSERS
jgi:hypothetical protein